MAAASDIRRIDAPRAVLGEGIRYDLDTDSVTYLDISMSRAWCIDKKCKSTMHFLGPEAAFAVRCDDERILAGGDGGLLMDGAPILGDFLSPEEVVNDGAVHPSGDLLVFGSRDRAEERPNGHMWCFGQSLIRLPWTFTVFNGPAFSPCGEWIYFADSPARTLYTARLDIAQQRIGAREVFAEVPETLGYPDGMICDHDGGLWSAHWDGGCITRYLPDGSVDRRVEMPVSRPTSLAFRGSTLLVTSAQDDGPAKEDTMDGCVFAFDADIEGPPSPRLARSTLASIGRR